MGTIESCHQHSCCRYVTTAGRARPHNSLAVDRCPISVRRDLTPCCACRRSRRIRVSGPYNIVTYARWHSITAEPLPSLMIFSTLDYFTAFANQEVSASAFRTHNIVALDFSIIFGSSFIGTVSEVMSSRTYVYVIISSALHTTVF